MKTLILILFLCALTWGAIHLWLTTPVVAVSNSTGQCVEVLPEGSCDDLPERYTIEWRQ